MREANIVRACVVAALALIAAMLVATVPAHGASGTPTGVAGETPTPTPTVTSTETPTPDPTVSPTPTETPTASPTATLPPDDRLLPDLIALPAGKPRIQVVRDGRLLRFETSLGNIGRGPIEVRPDRAFPCPAGKHNSTQIVYRDADANDRYARRTDTRVRRHRAGCMVYHPNHRHWHFEASARYTLVDPSQQERVVVTARRKVSFCLRDTKRVPERYGKFTGPDAYEFCTNTSAQGISVGWVDVYAAWLAGQSLRLPKNLKNGVYCLETTVDPLNTLLESNDKNNKSIRGVLIRGNRAAVYSSARCRR